MGTAKLIVTLDGAFVRELELGQDRVTIGRRPYNDIVLDSPAISGEHAVIANVLNESILEDLNSTNGTYVNGQPIKKHFLQNGDSIELVKDRIQYFDADHAGQAATSTAAAAPYPEVAGEPATLLVLNGSNAGKSMPLTKTITTLGRAGTQVAAITRSGNAYAIAHVEGPAPLVNQQAVGTTPHRLADGDVIDLSGTQLEFSQL